MSKRIPVIETFAYQPPVSNPSSTTPPALVLGERYLVPIGATGAWLGQDNNIAWADAEQWHFDIPKRGWITFLKHDNPALDQQIYYDGSTWKSTSALFAGDYLPQLPTATEDYIPQWDADGKALKEGKLLRTAVRADGDADDLSLVTEKAVRDAIDDLLGATDAMVFKGTIGTGGTVTSLPTTHSAGWTYKVITAATYAGKVCEVGDMIIAVVDRAGTGNVDADWTVVQANIDGAVTGPVSAEDENIAVFDGTTGKVIKDSGLSLADINDHIDDSSIHFTESSIDHKNIQNTQGYTHVQITEHINTASINRDMVYSPGLEMIVYSEVPVLPTPEP